MLCNKPFPITTSLLLVLVMIPDSTLSHPCNEQNCPVLFVPTDVGCQCVYSGLNGFDPPIHCHYTANSSYATLSDAYCMTYNESSGIRIAASPYCSCTNRKRSQCVGIKGYIKFEQEVSHDDINEVMCGEINRTGVLCSQCAEGLGPAVFSYGLQCVQCIGSARGWPLYFTLAFLPTTLFFLLLTVLQIQATSSALNCFVLVCQILLSVVNWSPLTLSAVPWLHTYQIALLTVYGIWNLDFFRYVLPNFCISENMTALLVVSLEYLVAVFPLLLITLAYVLIELHDRGCRVLVWVWKPFHCCFACFRRQWNPKATVIHAFTTFLLLSYVKISYVSLILLSPSFIRNEQWKKEPGLVVYYDPSMPYFSSAHIPYAVLAILVLCVFVLFPLLVLILYPTRAFQKCLNALHIRADLLRAFVDSLQGCYKDGTQGTRDCRYFAAVYLILRIALVGCIFIPTGAAMIVFLLVIVILFIIQLLVAFLLPHRNNFFNIVDSVALLCIVIVGTLGMFSHNDTIYIVFNVMTCFPLLYIVALAVIITAKKMRLLLSGVRANGCRSPHAEGEDSLPYRLVASTAL